jgi:hypothetical protein
MSISPIHCPDSGCYWAAFGIPDKYTEARAWHLAAHRAEEHDEPLTPEQLAYAARVGHVIPGAALTTAAAVAAQGALPVPVGDQPQPLDDTRLAEIATRVEGATPGPWGVYESGSMIDVAADLKETGCGYRARREICRLEDEPLDNDPTHREWTAEEDWAQVQADAEFIAHAATDVPALLAEVQRLKAELASAREDTAFLERNTLPELRRTVEHHQAGKQRWRERAQKAEAGLPSRFRATPAEVDWYLRKILTEESLLNYQRAIGNRAVEEAAEEIRQETARLKAHGVLEPDKDWAAATAADWIDTSKEGGHYPSKLLCARHDGFNPCPGAPRCTPREDEEAAS